MAPTGRALSDLDPGRSMSVRWELPDRREQQTLRRRRTRASSATA